MDKTFINIQLRLIFSNSIRYDSQRQMAVLLYIIILIVVYIEIHIRNTYVEIHIIAI